MYLYITIGRAYFNRLKNGSAEELYCAIKLLLFLHKGVAKRTHPGYWISLIFKDKCVA